MPTDFAFRLSLYLTLGFVTIAIGYAEYPLLPEVAFIAAGVLAALAILFHLETRVQLLSIPAANRLGLAVGLANFIWAAFRIANEFRNPELLHLNWQVLLVAVFGPLLLTLIPAKLARREKHAGDYWGLHGAALVAAALAGALAEDHIGFVLLLLYAGCAVWNLSVFYLRQAGRAIPPVPGRGPLPTFGGIVGGTPSNGFPAMKYVALCLAAVLPVYLLTPRSPAEKLELGKPRVEIGYAADQMIDLTQTGELEPNSQVAFEVRAWHGNTPWNALPLDLRWRGRMLRRYNNGIWQAGDFRLPAIEPLARNVLPWTPPPLAPDQLTLQFALPPSLPGVFLADPVLWLGQEAAPVATLTDNTYRSWVPFPDGTFLPGGRSAFTKESFHYVQIWHLPQHLDRSPVFRLTDTNVDDVLLPLCQNPVPRVKEYTDAVLDSLVQTGLLPADFRDRVRLVPRPEFHDLIARALARHLATEAKLTYTTNLRRVRKDVDPIEDFLDHSRAGHCERFATALALMLRSQGIPAVLILGFKGCELTDEPGKYLVRQEHAHAWVQALVPVPDQPLGPRLRTGDLCYWLTLDPTPQNETSGSGDGADNWLQLAEQWLRSRFREYFVNSTPEQRQEAVAAAVRWLVQPRVLAVAVLLVLGGVGVFVLRRRSRQRVAWPTPEHRWFDRLLAVLAAQGLVPAPGQTPREFALQVGTVLRQSPATRAVADVPLAWAEAYYETRFGGVPLAPDRQRALDTQLDQLQQALTA
jgi:transglutaminase-like putative cysteine protease